MVRVGKRTIEIIVGLFIIAGIVGLLVLAFKMSSFNTLDREDSYEVIAEFDNIGNLKVRAPVAIAGVKIGQVSDITLNDASFKAQVTMKVNIKDDTIPTDTAASILTQGLLGSKSPWVKILAAVSVGIVSSLILTFIVTCALKLTSLRVMSLTCPILTPAIATGALTFKLPMLSNSAITS